MVVETFSPEETEALGKKLGREAKPGDVYTLVGDLGVGKTVLTQGIANGLGITEPVNSPTFTIVQEYDEGRLPFYHFDVYRLEHPDPEQCDWMDDYLFGDGVCLIEWADNILAVLPRETIRIEFTKDPQRGENFREIKIC